MVSNMLKLDCCLVKTVVEYCFSCPASACLLEESTRMKFCICIFEMEPKQTNRGLTFAGTLQGRIKCHPVAVKNNQQLDLNSWSKPKNCLYAFHGSN